MMQFYCLISLTGESHIKCSIFHGQKVSQGREGVVLLDQGTTNSCGDWGGPAKGTKSFPGLCHWTGFDMWAPAPD